MLRKILGSGLSMPHFDIGDLSRLNRPLNEAMIRARCSNAYLGSHTALCRALGKYKVFVDTRDVCLAPHLMLDGYWELWLTEALRERVGHGMVVADIGANLGYFSLLMADLVGHEGHVHCFEPNPRLGTLLHQTLEINSFAGRTSVYEVALSDTEGQPMVLIIPPKQPMNAKMMPLPSGDLPEHAHPLQTRRLDSEEAWREIELAKIDVEGAEELLWAGAQGLLDGSRLKTVFLEFTPDRYQDPTAFLDRLQQPGFSISYLDPGKGIQPISREDILSGPRSQDVMLVLER